MTLQLLQLSIICLGSGAHCRLSMQVMVTLVLDLDTVGISSTIQLTVMFDPTNAGILCPEVTTLADSSNG